MYVCKPIYVKRRTFATFYPEAEAFLVNLGVQRKTFVTFYPERGSPTKIWKYMMAKGVRGLAP